jgi:insertion element IS1 protein InsB
MIITEQLHTCRACGSARIVKNGHNRCGNPQYKCKSCNAHRVVMPQPGYSADRRAEVARAYLERASLRGLSRIFGISRPTITEWIRETLLALPEIHETLLPAESDDVLELDEVWSFVYTRTNKCWLWTALCRRTRQIVAAVTGNRTDSICQRLWEQIPSAYQACHTFSDFWKAYDNTFPEKTHRSVGKETGETAHMERWNNTLRQRVGRFVRKSLSFSKNQWWHDKVTQWFIIDFNRSLTI